MGYAGYVKVMRRGDVLDIFWRRDKVSSPTWKGNPMVFHLSN